MHVLIVYSRPSGHETREDFFVFKVGIVEPNRSCHVERGPVHGRQKWWGDTSHDPQRGELGRKALVLGL